MWFIAITSLECIIFLQYFFIVTWSWSVQSEVRRGNSHRIFFFSLLELVVILVLKKLLLGVPEKWTLFLTWPVQQWKAYRCVLGVKIICAVSRFTYIYVHVEDRKIAPIVLLLYFLKSFYLPHTRNMYFICFTFFVQWLRF